MYITLRQFILLTFAAPLLIACDTTVPGPNGPIQLSAAERFTLPDSNAPRIYEIPDQILIEGSRARLNVFAEQYVEGYNPCRLGYELVIGELHVAKTEDEKYGRISALKSKCVR